jgi:hypothetical protein
MKMHSTSRNVLRAVTMAVTITCVIATSGFGEDVPDSIRAEWKFKSEQIEARWDSKTKVLELHQSTAKAIVYGPGNLYELPYQISFHSTVPDASIILVLGDDGNPTCIPTRVLKENESQNPRVYLINKVGMVVEGTNEKPDEPR